MAEPDPQTALARFVAAELALPVAEPVTALAEALAHGYAGSARAVLFYGSCLRDQAFEGLMLDFYLIVSDYTSAYSSPWLARANRWVPPNVFPFTHNGLVAKYAVLSEADLASQCTRTAATVSVWARFAQPARLVWAADDAAALRTVESVARAAPTLLALARPMVQADARDDGLALWREGFALTYDAELRAERATRPAAVVDAAPERYRQLAALALPTVEPLAPAQARRLWRRLRRNGKFLTLVRLAKAGFTFAGGIEYLAWKINRHAGTAIRLKPWQRRWPIAGAISLLPRLLIRGAIR